MCLYSHILGIWMQPMYIAICTLFVVKTVNHIPQWHKLSLISYMFNLFSSPFSLWVILSEAAAAESSYVSVQLGLCLVDQVWFSFK